METDINIITILLDLLITFVFYESVPLILKYILKKQYSEKEAKKIAIINSIVVYIVFTALYRIMNVDQVANMTVSFFWGCISYHFLKSSSKRKEKNQKVLEFSKPFVISLVIIFLMICFGIYAYFSSENTELQNDYQELYESYEQVRNDFEELQKNYKELKISNYRPVEDVIAEKDKLSFMDNHVVIVPNNTRVYHKYRCQYLDISDGGLVFNPENADSEGYVPCSSCIK